MQQLVRSIGRVLAALLLDERRAAELIDPGRNPLAPMSTVRSMPPPCAEAKSALVAVLAQIKSNVLVTKTA